MADHPAEDPGDGQESGPRVAPRFLESLSDRHGLVFDVSAIAGWLALRSDAIPYPSGLREALAPFRFSFESGPLPPSRERLIGLVLVGGIATQILGSLLKARSLRHRLRVQGPAIPAGLLGFFWFLHLIFFLLATTFCMAMLGWINLSGETSPFHVALMFAVGGGTTLIAKAAASPSKGKVAPLPGIEIVGTELLSISALLLGSVFWEPMAEWMMSNSVQLEPWL